MKARNVLITAATVVVAGAASYLWLHPFRYPEPSPAYDRAVTNAQPPQNIFSASQWAMAGTRIVASSSSVSPLESEIPKNVRTIVDLQVDYFKRCASVQALTSAPTAAERRSLYNFLGKRSDWDDRQQGQVVKNELLDVLCAQVPRPPGLTDTMIHIYRDKEQHIVLRDYAVQHLVTHYENLELANSAAVSPSQRAEEEAIRKVLHEALKEVDSSIAGTALLGLSLLAQDHPGFDRQQIAAAALHLAREGAGGELTRITALQVCGRLGLKEALPVVSEVTKGGETMALRISAVAALGALGGVKVKPFLQDLLNGAEERLKMPARQALKRIQEQEAHAAKVETKG